MGYICEQILEDDGSNGGIKSNDAFYAKGLYSAISEKGQLRLKSKASPYVVTIDANKCECAEDGCERIMFEFNLSNGVFKKYYLFDDLFISQFDSIRKFVEMLATGCITDTYGERLRIEELAENTFGCHYSKASSAICYCEDCAADIGLDNLWRNMVASQLCNSLTSRDEIIEKARLNYGDGAVEWIEMAFDIGYITGRQFSEYYVKNDMEADVLKGRKQESARKKAGEKGKAASERARTRRILSLLEAMELLTRDNPAISRLGEMAAAGIALEDCTKAEPSLWAQGQGQLDGYLSALKCGDAGPEAQARYLAMFPFKTA